MSANTMEKAIPVCANCLAEVSSITTEGLCPKCLIQRALDAQEPTSADIPDAVGREPLPTTPFTGTRLRYFGDYELLEEIARGGMGIVFKARQLSLNRLVALKLINAGALASEAFIKRFKAEAEAAAAVNHPHIVPIHEIGEIHGQHYFSMDLVEGPNLDQYLASKPVPIQRAGELILTLACAVQHAHQHGVLHRDIKPSNILIDKEGDPHLMDFGLAKLVQKDSTLTHTNAIMGTPSYMAPEQARGENKLVTTASDVYGLGAVLYACLTGHPPFAGGTTYETIRQVLEQEPRPPSEWNPLVDRDVETICLKCLEKDPQRRYGTAAAFEMDVRRWLNHEPVEARPSSWTYKLQKWVQRRPAIAALSATVVLLLIGIAVGSTVAVFRLKKEAALTEAANEESKAKLWDSYVAHARASRLSGQPGQRFTSLDLIKKALEIKPADELRNEAVAAMGHADMRPVRTVNIGKEGEGILDLDPAAAFYAHDSMDGAIKIHRSADDSLVTSLKSPGKVLNKFPGCSWTKKRFVGNYADRTILVWDLEESRVLLTVEGDRTAIHEASNRLAVGAHPDKLQLYDLGSLTLERSITLPIIPFWFAFSSDGTKLAISSELHTVVVVVDVSTGQIIRKLEHPTMVRQIAWRSDQNILACPLPTGEIYIWDVDSGRRQRTLSGHGPHIISLAFVPGSDFLISSGWDGSVRVWDSITGGSLFRNSVSGGVYISPSGDKLWLMDWGRNALSLFDLALPEVFRDRPFQQQIGHAEAGVSFSPDSALLVLTFGKSLQIMDARTRKLLAIVQGTGNLYSHMAPSGEWLVVESGQGLFLWPIHRKTDVDEMVIGPARQISETSQADWAQFVENSRYLVFRENNQVKLFSTANLRVEKSFPLYQSAQMLKMSPNGSNLLAWSGSDLKRFEVVGETLLQMAEPKLPGGHAYFSYDGAHIVIAGSGGYSLRETRSWSELASLSLPVSQSYGGVTLAAEYGVAALRENQHLVRLVSFPTLKSLATISLSTTSDRLCVLLSPDAQTLAGFCVTGELSLCNLNSLQSRLDQIGLAWPDPPARRNLKPAPAAPARIKIVRGEFP